MISRWLLVPSAFALLFCGCSSSSSEETPKTPVADSGADQNIILDGGGGIPDPPDGAAHCPKGACNYQSQSGCSSPMACQPQINDGGIVPACAQAGSVQSGGTCSTWTDCVAGTICAGGACRTLCCGKDWSACPKGESCFTELALPVNGTVTPANVMVCLATVDCGIFDGSGCPTGKTCQMIDPTGATACITGGKGVTGEDCPCASGYGCVGSPLKCRKLCKAVAGGGEPSCSDSDGICVHFDRDPAGVGECTP